MSDYYTTCAIPKTKSKLVADTKKDTTQRTISKAVKRAVMERDAHTCRVCGKPAESVHELRFQSLGGKVALANSIAVCGDGVRGCHGKLQRNRLRPIGNPNGKMRFTKVY